MRKASKAFKFELGAHVRDTITKMFGVVTARCERGTHNCYGVQSTQLRDGVPVDEVWLNEERLAGLSK
jgi:hypothetical protein